MKAGDVIAGYRVVSEPTNAGGGKCVWAFAEKDGAEFFLKRFLEPKRPREGSAAGAASRRIREEVCRDFEERHRGVIAALRPDAPGAGNLVVATDFFHEGSTYYKVTERIDTSSLAEPHSLDPRERSVLLRTLGTSLRLLHSAGIVHGDLKPANVLVQRRDAAAFHTAKLIDFDDSYLAGLPPGREEIAGDSLYGAPEWRRYVQGDESAGGELLTGAVDVFALGLTTHLWLTGALPGYDGDRFGSPADAVNAGEPLAVDRRLSRVASALLEAMTARDPGARPPVTGFLAALRDHANCALGAPRPRESRLRVNLPGARAGATAAGAAGAAVSGGAVAPGAGVPPRSRVRINLAGRTGDSARHRPTGGREEEETEENP
jgi:eukaryotic-like serine/threonine-protein kinase